MVSDLWDSSDPWDGSDSWDGGAAAIFSSSPYPVAVVRLALGKGPFDEIVETDWTNVSAYHRQTHIERGKSHELGRTIAGFGWSRMKSRDRRFDAFYAAGPYYPNLVPLCPIQIGALVGTTFYPRITAFITNYGQSWPPRPIQGLGDGEVRLEYIDAFGVLSLEPLDSFPDTVLADAPSGYWRMNDATQVVVGGIDPTRILNYGSQLTSGVGEETLDLQRDLASVALGAFPGPLASTKTVASINGDASSSAMFNDLIRDAGDVWNSNAWEFWIDPVSLTTGDGIGALYEYTSYDGFHPSGTAWRLEVADAGAIKLSWTYLHAPVSTTSPAGLLTTTDGNQLIGIAIDNGIVYWYKGGVLFGTSDAPPPRDVEDGVWNLAALVWGAAYLDGQCLNGELSHCSTYTTISQSRFAFHFLARVEEFDAADAGTQINQILDAVGWPASKRDIDVGSTVMQGFSPSGSALDLILAIGEDSEQGLVQCTADGTILFHSRDDLVLQHVAPVAVFGDGTGETNYRDVQIQADEKDLYSVVQVSREGGADFLAFDPTARGRYGGRRLTKSGLSFDSDVDSLDCSRWLHARYRATRERPQSVLFHLGSDATLSAAVLSRETHGDPVTLNRRPPGGGLKSIPAQIEGLIDDVTFGANPPWQTEFQLVPSVASEFWTTGLSRIGIDNALGW